MGTRMMSTSSLIGPQASSEERKFLERTALRKERLCGDASEETPLRREEHRGERNTEERGTPRREEHRGERNTEERGTPRREEHRGE
jgi:hypothetical protein